MRRITRILGMVHIIPDAAYLKLAYRLEFGEDLNFADTVTLNQKLQWLKLNGAMQRFSDLADKWKARGHVRRVLGEQYLVPMLGVYDRAEEIPWHALPDQFVAKCTHGSHCGVICTDRTTFDRRAAARKLNRWLKRNWYWFGREPVYRNMEPRILVEQFVGKRGQVPADYKVMCYHGVPQVVQVHEKTEGVHSIGFYSESGKKLGIYKVGYPTGQRERLEPALLAPLLMAAKRLAESVDAPYLRTDFYLVDGQVYFSEMTFFDSSGFRRFGPDGADEWLGSMLKLDVMTCPACGGPMKWRTIAGSRWADKVERYDECPGCGRKRMVRLDASS